MTPIVWIVLATAVVVLPIGIVIGSLLAAADHPWDDLESIETWQHRQRCLRTEVE